MKKPAVRKTYQDKINALREKCTNTQEISQFITAYQTQTKSAVENTLNMCETVNNIHQKVKTGILNEIDLDYFCLSVGLSKNSSTFRKYVCIANHADKFRVYLDRMPSACSVLYEITTLDPDMFDNLINNNLLSQRTTLTTLKKITGKVPVKNNSSSKNCVTLKIEFDPNLITKKDMELINTIFSYVYNNQTFHCETTNLDAYNQINLKDAA